MNKLRVTVLMVVCLALAPGTPALAQSAVEYGVMVNKNHGASKLGSATSHKVASVQTRQPSHKPSKAKA